VLLSSEAEWNSEMDRPPLNNGRLYRAMIDTGAEGTAIDEGVASEVGAPPVGNATIHDFGDVVQNVAGADLRIFFPSIGVCWTCRAFRRDFRQSGSRFDLILGRSFLE